MIELAGGGVDPARSLQARQGQLGTVVDLAFDVINVPVELRVRFGLNPRRDQIGSTPRQEQSDDLGRSRHDVGRTALSRIVHRGLAPAGGVALG